MNGLIVTVFWAWSAKMSWKIWEGVSGLRCCHFSLASVEKKSIKANLVVADQPNSWGLVILVVCDHYIVCADLKQIALCDFHISTTRKSSATLLISSKPNNHIPSINHSSSRYN